MTLLDRPPTLSTRSTPATRTVGQQHQGVVLVVFMTLLLLVSVGGRLAHLQLLQGERSRELADENRIRLIPKQAEQGKLLDRNGKILAGSRLSYSVFLYPIAIDKASWSTTRQQLAQILRIPEAEIQKRLEQAGDDSPLLVRVARGLSPAQITAIEEYKSEMPGVEVDAEPVRYYPNGDLAAHILGYTGEITDEQLQKQQDQDYRLGDVVGQTGLEEVFEKQLRGERGGQQVEVDGAGQVIRILGEKPVQVGQDVRLTIDVELQKAAEVALGDRKGAVVAIDPNNGEILAMASRPTFDPNLFSNSNYGRPVAAAPAPGVSVCQSCFARLPAC